MYVSPELEITPPPPLQRQHVGNDLGDFVKYSKNPDEIFGALRAPKCLRITSACPEIPAKNWGGQNWEFGKIFSFPGARNDFLNKF